MKKIFLFAAATAVALSSCSKNEVMVNPADATNAIGFGVYTGISTKGAVTAIPENEAFSMGVLGYYTDGSTWASATAPKPNFMYNQMVTTSDKGANWTYSPIKYWPNETSDNISFFAYAPYLATNAEVEYFTLSANNATGAPTATFDYTAADFDATATTDFVAGNAIDKNKTSNADASVADASVAFTLKHELTRVNLSVALATDLVEDDDNSVVVVKSVKFGGAKVANKGTYTFSDTDATAGTWDFTDATDASFEMAPCLVGYATDNAFGAKKDYTEKGLPLSTDDAATLGEDEYIFLLPAYASDAEATSAKTGDVSLTIVYDVVTNDAALENESYSAIENTKVLDLTNGTLSLKQGVAYAFAITIGVDDVTLSATVDEAWEEEEDVNVNNDGTTSKEYPTVE